MNPTFLKYKLHFIFQTIAENSPVGSAQHFQKHLPFTETQSRLGFYRWKCIIANN